ncbi:MAG: hypothetical protein GX115_02265 [Ruminiclostridium sp.]|nr:hypothetical protein [Ruminiclostridium sp.]
MKGNEIINHIVRAEMPDMEQIREKCIRQVISQEQPRKRPRFRAAVTLATTAVVVICLLFGTMLLNPHGDNVFFVKAYAMEQQPDGSIGLREVDVVNQPDVWGGYTDGKVFYVSVGLKCEGENIKSIEFSTEEGFFAKQHIDDLKNSEDVKTLYVGAESRIAVYGTDFETVGDKIILNKDTLSDDLLLFWGTENNDLKNIPQKIDIQAKATFDDGRTDERTVTIDLSGMGLIVGPVPVGEEKSEQFKEQYDYYKNIPLEQCELMPESVKTVTDVYEYKIGNSVARYVNGCNYLYNRGGTVTAFAAQGTIAPSVIVAAPPKPLCQ